MHNDNDGKMGPAARVPNYGAASGGRAGDNKSRRTKVLGALIATLVIAGAAVLALSRFGTELMWFNALGYSRVLWTAWVARAVMFVVGFLVMFIALYTAQRIAHRLRPGYVPTGEPDVIAEYRARFEPFRRGALIAIPLVVGLFGGLAASARWQQALVAANWTRFGVADPQFGLDVGFFVFLLPLIRFGLNFLLVALVLATLAALLVHLLAGGVRLGVVDAGAAGTTPGARTQVGLLAAAIFATVAARIWLSRYSLLTAAGEKFDGAAYTAIHATLPARTILTVVALLVAVVVLIAATRGQWRLLALAPALLEVTAVVLAGFYPALVQRFQVAPNAQELEQPYIQRNMDATKFAFGVDGLETQPYNADVTATPEALRASAETTASIRLLDPQIVSPSFRQLQQNKQYYDFPNQLSVDRYTIDGVSHDTVIAVRELNLAGLGAAQRNWVNDHTVFTHGYGVVAAYGNQTGPDGRPAFFEGGIPTAGLLTDSQHYEPRIYFSPNHLEYSIVGAPPGVTPWELDYQVDDDDGGYQVNTAFPTSEVSGGPSLRSLFAQLLYAIKFGDEQILFSDRVNEASQILYDRDPRVRVAKVAPWLELDFRVYPAVVDGRVVWILDGYTTSTLFPYAEHTPLTDLGYAGLTAAQANMLGLTLPREVNYIRNSVKAVVDAYDGSVTLYAWDNSDPLLAAWNNAYGGVVQPTASISADLMSHLRYPEDLFKMQRMLLQRYHVRDAAEFFSGQDFWRVPNDPTVDGDAGRPLQPPYYLTLEMPGQSAPAFSLTSLFIPGGNSDREILTGFLAVDSEAGDQAGAVAPGYGQLRLLEMPRDVTVPGPGQVQTNFNTNPTISQQLNILEIGSSQVVRGNQLTLPVGGGLLYVQPVYIQSAQGTRFPLLRKVLVAFGDSTGFADTLQGALDQVFSGSASATTTAPPVSELVPPREPLPTEPGLDATPPAEPGTAADAESSLPGAVPGQAGAGPVELLGPVELRSELAAALAAANQALRASQEALRAGDFAAYGAAQDQLQRAVERAVAVEAGLAAFEGAGALP